MSTRTALVLLVLAGCTAEPKPAPIAALKTEAELEREWELRHEGGGSGSENVVPVPKALAPVAAAPGDDWTQFGHDATRSFVSKEALELPFTVAWTWTPTAPAKHVANAVAAAGYVHVHCVAEGNGLGMQSGFRNPWLVTLATLTGEYRGGYTPQKDVTQGNWLAVFEDFNVLYIDDALGAYDCRSFSDRRWVALDRWGPLAVDHQLKIVEHVNNQMADADLPMIEAHKLSGTSLWRNNIWKIGKGQGTISPHEVNISQGICLCAVTYTGAPGPKNGLYAFEALKGAQLWLCEGTFKNVVSSAKRAYAIDGAGAVRVLELRTGKDQGSLAFPSGLVSSPGLWKDRLVGLTTSGELVALAAEENDGGKILWRTRVEGAMTAPGAVPGVGMTGGNDRSAILLDQAGRALVCTRSGVAVLDLADGKELGRWTAEGAAKAILAEGPVCPIVSRGTIVLCGKSGVVALWTQAFLRANSALVVRQADALAKAGRTADALRMARAVADIADLKDDKLRKAKEAITAIGKLGEKELAEVAKLEAKGHLHKAKAVCDDLAARFAGADVGQKAADAGAALAKKLEDSAVASEAAYQEAAALESAGKRKEAARAYKAAAEQYPDTDFGKKAAACYEKLKAFDK